jgi:myosin-5
MMSLVHVAARNGDLNLARYVLEEIPQMEDMVFGKDANGNTPLHFASAIAHLDMVKFLAKIANQNAAPSPGGGNNANFSLANFLRSSESRSNDSDFDCPESSRTVNSNSSPKSIIGVTDEPKGPTPPVAAATGRMRNASIASADLAGPLRDSITTSGGRRSRANTVRRSLVTTPSTGRRLTNTMLSSGLGTTSVQMNIYKEGFLKKASGNRLATKRYVMVDEASLSYYKTPKDKIPLMIMELCDATIKRITQIEHCFEIASPRLKSNRNPEGILSFVAESEGEVHDWMATIRKVPGVRIATKNPPYQNMICIDSGLRREYVNMKNKAGYTPLHLAVQNDDEGFDAVKTAVWLIENGAEVNAKDNVGDTALHFAVMLHRDDLVETLMKKGADSSIQNAKGLTPIDISIEEETRVLLDPNHLLAKTKQRPFVLLNPPVRLPDSTYVSVFLGAAAVASGPIMETPYFKLSILDAKSNIVETSQMTPNSLIQDGVSFMWYGNTWYIQTPLEHLKEGCVAVFELMYYNYQSDKDEVGCFTFFRLDLGKITSAPVTFEMYAPPTDPFSQYLARIPGDSFFQAEINVSL